MWAAIPPGPGHPYRVGDVISIVPVVSTQSNACDITNATISVQFAKPDGSFNGPTVVAATGVHLAPGTSNATFPAVQHTVDYGPAVFRGDVSVILEGTRHTAEPDPASGFIASSTALLTVTHPHATLGVTRNPAVGDPPLGVTYDYAVNNDSAHDSGGMPDPLMNGVSVSDDHCSPVTFVNGDGNSNSVVDRGETWNFTCTTTYTAAGVFTDHARVQATNVADGRPWPATTGQSTVTVNGPDLALAASHSGDFTQGDTRRTYTLAVSNAGNATAGGAMSVADTVPAGLTATGISGPGWTCSVASVSCTRSDALAASASYPPITVTVDVARDAPPAVTNTATLARTGDNAENNTSSDPTTIAPHPADQQQTVTGDQTTPVVPPVPPLPPDLSPPTFSALWLTNKTFAVSGPAEPLVSARAKKGTAFAYSLSEPARVVFAIEQKTTGRRSGRKCVKQTKRNRRKKKCTLWVKRGAIGRNGALGANTKPWSGKLGSKALGPGSYRAQIVATDGAGNKSAARQLTFKVVKR